MYQGLVEPVSGDDIASQKALLASSYLTLPGAITIEDSIIMVDSMATLQLAHRELLGPPTGLERNMPQGCRFVGVDSEWRAVMGLPKKKKGAGPMSNRGPDAGASILQVLETLAACVM